jgi:hypothetical protein
MRRIRYAWTAAAILMLVAHPSVAGITLERNPYEPGLTGKCMTEEEQLHAIYTGLRLCEPWEDPTYKKYYPDYQAPAHEETRPVVDEPMTINKLFELIFRRP